MRLSMHAYIIIPPIAPLHRGQDPFSRGAVIRASLRSENTLVTFRPLSDSGPVLHCPVVAFLAEGYGMYDNGTGLIAS